MPRGISLNIGLNRVDPNHYAGWSGPLAACEADARDMQAIAQAQGFTTTLLLTEAGTAQAVTDALAGAADGLADGDALLVTYSGHGGQVPDTNGEEGADAMDETWVLYDRQLVDDELYALWAAFKPGVRIFVLSDSCHSGSVVREAFDVLAAVPAARALTGGGELRFRALPPAVQDATYAGHQAVYDDIQRGFPSGDRVEVGASVVLISGCQDNQLSADGDRNGLFTQRLREVWADGGFAGTYRRFHRQIAGTMPPWQSPNYFAVGTRNPRFERQRPFTL